MLRNRLLGFFLIVALASLFLLNGCATVSNEIVKKERNLFASWGEENKRQYLALGERVYDKEFDLVFSAIVIAMANSGFSVKNMERASGYILAEGPAPLSAEQEVRVFKPCLEELNRISGYQRWRPTPGNSIESVTITLLRLQNKRTKVKIRISNVAIKSNASSIYYSSCPSLLAEVYKVVWRAVDKQIFLDESLDGTD
jgi:hypothetical protein